jgi:hypothetical protein
LSVNFRKQEKRDLYQDALGLFQARPPDQTFTEAQAGKTYAEHLWEESGLPFRQDHPQPLRVVRTQEGLTQRHYRGEQKQTEATRQEWVWITTVTVTFPASVVRRLGHARWKNEDNGWMDLTQHWDLKHGFLHACRHRPPRRPPSGQRQPVPNHGLAAVTLILLIAFALCSAFVLRHCKLARRDHLTTLAVAAQLRGGISHAPPFDSRPHHAHAPATSRLAGAHPRFHSRSRTFKILPFHPSPGSPSPLTILFFCHPPLCEVPAP